MEIFFKKVSKSFWACYDREGNRAVGKTKELAKQRYYLQYALNNDPVLPEIDISKYLPNIENQGEING